MNDLLVQGGRGEPHGGGVSYHPYLVYLQGAGTKFALNEALSEKWSRENNFEWQGSKYSGAIVVEKSGKNSRSNRFSGEGMKLIIKPSCDEAPYRLRRIVINP